MNLLVNLFTKHTLKARTLAPWIFFSILFWFFNEFLLVNYFGWHIMKNLLKKREKREKKITSTQRVG
jgi:hypothetical protein